MKLRTLLGLFFSGRLGLLWRLSRDVEPVYRTAFLATAGANGVLSALAAGPQSLSDLAATLGLTSDAHEALAAWLSVGVGAGVLKRSGDHYQLRGKVARALATGDQDAFVAMLQQTLGLHRQLIMEAPARLQAARPFTLADQDGRLIARVSKLVEPFVDEALDGVIPRSGPYSLLDVGCGEGRYLRHACGRNPQLAALGLELQDDVAQMCRDNIRAWGLADRVRVEVGDIRQRLASPEFDLVTLHSLIYYFPWQSRVELLRQLAGFLKPGGQLMITTSCQSDQPTLAVLNLWATTTAGCGRLPTADEMTAQLQEAGFAHCERRAIIPGEHVVAFTARRD